MPPHNIIFLVRCLLLAYHKRRTVRKSKGKTGGRNSFSEYVRRFAGQGCGCGAGVGSDMQLLVALKVACSGVQMESISQRAPRDATCSNRFPLAVGVRRARRPDMTKTVACGVRRKTGKGIATGGFRGQANCGQGNLRCESHACPSLSPVPGFRLVLRLAQGFTSLATACRPYGTQTILRQTSLNTPVVPQKTHVASGKIGVGACLVSNLGSLFSIMVDDPPIVGRSTQPSRLSSLPAHARTSASCSVRTRMRTSSGDGRTGPVCPSIRQTSPTACHRISQTSRRVTYQHPGDPYEHQSVVVGWTFLSVICRTTDRNVHPTLCRETCAGCLLQPVLAGAERPIPARTVGCR
jgi:hypothetical protein